MNATPSETLSTRAALDGLTGGPSQVKMLLASIVTSTSKLCRPFANFALMLRNLAEWPCSQHKDTKSHLYFVLQQTHPSRRPDFAKYPTLLSKALFICDPYVWPNLANKTVRTLLSPTEMWNFMCLGPLVAPIAYLLFLCSLFCILKDPKVKSVKLRTWIITACVWISLMATLALAENTKCGKRTAEALFAALSPLMDYLPSLQPLDQLVERASQTVGLPFRFLPSWLFLIKLGYHIYLVCCGWQDFLSHVAEDERRRATQRSTRNAAHRTDSDRGLPQDEIQERQNFIDAMRKHFAVIEEQLAVKAMHEANMQRMLNEWREADGQQQIDTADTPLTITSLQDMEEGSNNIDAKGDGENDDDTPNDQQPSVDDSQSATGLVEGQTSADQPPKGPGDAPNTEEELAKQDFNSPEHHQPPADGIQSPTSPAKDQTLAYQPPQEFGNETSLESENGERAHSSLEHQQASVDFALGPTSPVEGHNLKALLGAHHNDDLDYEEEVEEDGDDAQGGDFDNQSSPQMTCQTAESSHSADGHNGGDEQTSPHSTQSDKSSQSADGPEDEVEQSSRRTIDQTAGYSHNEYSNEGEEKQSSPQTNEAAGPFHSQDDQEDEEHSSSQSTQPFRRTEFRLEDHSPQPRQSFDLSDLEDSQYFINECDYHAVANEMHRFLKPVLRKPEGQREGKKHAQTDGTSELAMMAGEQFGDERVTSAELEGFRKEGQEEDQNKLPSDHLEKLAETQSFKSKADEQHDPRSLENFLKDGEAAEQAQQQARPNGNEELSNFQQGHAFVDEEDEKHNARAFEKFIKDGKVKQQQEASQPNLKALSNAQSFVEGAEVAKTAQEVHDFIEEGKAEKLVQQAAQSLVDETEVSQTAREVDNSIKEGKAEKQVQQALQPDLNALSNAQSFVEKSELAETAREVDEFVEEGNAEQQQKEKAQADRNEELKAFQKGQAIVDEKDEQHNQRSLENFMEDGEAEKQAQQASQPDLNALPSAQSFDEEDDKDSTDVPSSTHDGDEDDDGLQTVREEHEDDEDDADSSAYTLSNTRDHYDERLDKEQATQRGE